VLTPSHFAGSALNSDLSEKNSAFSTSRAWISINRQAIHHNVRVLQSYLSPGAGIWAVVKANAYGHGAPLMAREVIAAGVTGLCVATLPEGIELREAGIQAPILILGPINTLEEVEVALQWDLELSLTRVEQIDLYCQITKAQIPIHMNVDTGMTRLGIPWGEAAAIWQNLLSLSQFTCRSLYSHLATADEADLSVLTLQQRRFSHVLNTLQEKEIPLPILHLDNSAGCLVHRDGHYQFVRLGLILYGILPAAHLPQISVKPVLSVLARVTHLQTISSGTGVSYGYRYIASEPRRIATVSIGYADGIPRRLSGWLQGQVRGQRIQQVGTITMDHCMWDVTNVEDIAVGDVVQLIGEGLSVQDWADHLGTIAYEILCGFSPRLPRVMS
jgi:alanine racemase